MASSPMTILYLCLDKLSGAIDRERTRLRERVWHYCCGNVFLSVNIVNYSMKGQNIHAPEDIVKTTCVASRMPLICHRKLPRLGAWLMVRAHSAHHVYKQLLVLSKSLPLWPFGLDQV